MIAGRALCAFLAALCLTVSSCGGSGGDVSTTLADAGKAAAGAPASSASAAVGAGADVAAVAQKASDARAPVQLQEKISTGADRAANPIRPRAKTGAPVPTQLVLPAYSGKKPAAQKSSPAGIGLPTQVGVARDIVDTANVQKLAGMMGWSASPRGGKSSAVRFVSTGAQGVRLGLLVRSLPLGSVVRVTAASNGMMPSVWRFTLESMMK